MLTLEEIKEKILQFYDPDDLIESLHITAEEILDRFDDKLVKRLDEFLEEFEEDEEDVY